MYLKRHIEKILKKAVGEFPVIVLCGARQTGKSTLLKHCFGDKFTYLTFDDLTLRGQAANDPELFLNNFQGDLILDEIQYAPKLLSAVKMAVDSNNKRRFILTGSQQFNMIRGLKETLAGRALLLTLHPMTAQEKAGMGDRPHWLENILSGDFSSTKHKIELPEFSPANELKAGGLPGILEKSEEFHSPYFESYVKTYVERDIPSLYTGADPVNIAAFLRMLAPLTSQEINKSQIGRELGISSPTANRWIEWLKAGFIWSSVPSYSGNILKRVSQSPKGMLFDTGLICHLLKVHDTETLLAHPLLGGIYESRIVGELLAVIDAKLIQASVYHWRTSYGKEVDIVIEKGGRLFALECKWRRNLKTDDMSAFKTFQETYGGKVAFMGVITPTGHNVKIAENIFQIPWMKDRKS